MAIEIKRDARKSSIEVNGVVVGCVVRSAEPNPNRGPNVKREVWVGSSKLIPGFSYHEHDREFAEDLLVVRLESLFAKNPAELYRIALEGIVAMADDLSDEQLSNLDGLPDGAPIPGLLVLAMRNKAKQALSGRA